MSNGDILKELSDSMESVSYNIYYEPINTEYSYSYMPCDNGVFFISSNYSSDSFSIPTIDLYIPDNLIIFYCRPNSDVVYSLSNKVYILKKIDGIDYRVYRFELGPGTNTFYAFNSPKVFVSEKNQR